jgi:hypothetical protein
MTYGLAGVSIPHEWFAPSGAVLMLVGLTYAAGRVHQFFKQTNEREQAFRDGYNTATRSLFALATRTARGLPPVPPKPVRGYASVPHEQRSPAPAKHRAAGRRKPSPSDTKKLNWPPNQRAA